MFLPPWGVDDVTVLWYALFGYGGVAGTLIILGLLLLTVARLRRGRDEEDS
jgi:nitrate reductase gamma subunit